MEFQYNDGGRKENGFKGTTKDCVARAITIITGLPYIRVIDDLYSYIEKERVGKRQKRKSDPYKGVYKKTYNKYLKDLGYKWIPCTFIGKGCTVHLRAEELPKGRLIARLSRHLTAVIDGVIHDTFNPDRNGTRCVYGYYIKEN